MTDMMRMLNELDELRTQNVDLKNQNCQLQLENNRLKNECEILHAQLKNNINNKKRP